MIGQLKRVIRDTVINNDGQMITIHGGTIVMMIGHSDDDLAEVYVPTSKLWYTVPKGCLVNI